MRAASIGLVLYLALIATAPANAQGRQNSVGAPGASRDRAPGILERHGGARRHGPSTPHRRDDRWRYRGHWNRFPWQGGYPGPWIWPRRYSYPGRYGTPRYPHYYDTYGRLSGEGEYDNNGESGDSPIEMYPPTYDTGLYDVGAFVDGLAWWFPVNPYYDTGPVEFAYTPADIPPRPAVVRPDRTTLASLILPSEAKLPLFKLVAMPRNSTASMQ
jgi:hypothetical protein